MIAIKMKKAARKKIDYSPLEQIDPLEIRLDATLLAIYVLCRFLFYDITTGAKQTPRWELHDAIMVLQTFSSAIVLSGLWTMMGVFGTGIFQYGNNDNSNGDNNVVWKKSTTYKCNHLCSTLGIKGNNSLWMTNSWGIWIESTGVIGDCSC